MATGVRCDAISTYASVFTYATFYWWEGFPFHFINDKRELFQAVTVSILLYSCTNWTQAKCLKKKTRWQLQTEWDKKVTKSSSAIHIVIVKDQWPSL